MSFNYTVTVQPVANLTAVGGVQSVLLTWENPADYTRVEVWSSTTDNFATATKLGSTTDVKFIDEDRIATVERFYWVRVVRTYAASDTKYSTLVSASAIPTGASVGPASVDTIHIAADAVTDRTIIETVGTWAQRGKDPGSGAIVPVSDWSTNLLTLDFEGDGSAMIIEVIVQQAESYPFFRGPGQVSCSILCEIIDMEDPDNWVWIASSDLHVESHLAQQMPINPSQWFTTSYSRDYHQKFILPSTVPGKLYTLLIDQTIFIDNNDNFFMFDSGNVKVLWEMFKR
ncbi:hypothetical protein IGS68_31600 (plasmid) [Skermanella sp. TT6]|uniref:Fibronectin type-III domain-containing protein n=1 Tax=Skermanella cutis TaxID=2775420 RepID=A0ABX7BKK6_9PROT|nr:hypothetical protein [Skermanella sp. TT6]QQP93572.1 hypothetical protein IGS68_31600 [Skermanella sp. TT6]